MGQLYSGTEGSFACLTAKLGEKRLFVGSAHAQATKDFFGWPGLVPVTGLDASKRAIEAIITEGEGAGGDRKNARLGRFYDVLNEYLEFKRQDPAFEPARPAVAAVARGPSDMSDIARITNSYTAGVSGLFIAAFELAIQLLSRFFMHTETAESELHVLGESAFETKIGVPGPLGRLLTTLPVGKSAPGRPPAQPSRCIIASISSPTGTRPGSSSTNGRWSRPPPAGGGMSTRIWEGSEVCAGDLGQARLHPGAHALAGHRAMGLE